MVCVKSLMRYVPLVLRSASQTYPSRMLSLRHTRGHENRSWFRDKSKRRLGWPDLESINRDESRLPCGMDGFIWQYLTCRAGAQIFAIETASLNGAPLLTANEPREGEARESSQQTAR
jgi:hypothetical protein